MAMSIRKNDQVMVRAGKDRGKKGRVLSVVPATNRVIVEGVNLIKRHTRPKPIKNPSRMGGQQVRGDQDADQGGLGGGDDGDGASPDGGDGGGGGGGGESPSGLALQVAVGDGHTCEAHISNLQAEADSILSICISACARATTTISANGSAGG